MRLPRVVFDAWGTCCNAGNSTRYLLIPDYKHLSQSAPIEGDPWLVSMAEIVGEPY